jgi:uncharacterized membrane protein YozB (DUF420 family)
MAFFDVYTLIATASLALQVAVFILLVVGYVYMRRQRFRLHGTLMALAVGVHLLAVFAVMIPSFVLAVVPSYIVPEPLLLTSVAGLIHAVLGVAAISLGVYLVAAWRVSGSLQGCFTRKKMMLLTLAVWLVALLLGFLLYGLFYGMLIAG